MQILLVFLLLAYFYTICRLFWFIARARKLQIVDGKYRSVQISEAASCQQLPLIFVPGSSAGTHRFDATFWRLRRLGQEHSLLRLKVMPDGQIRSQGWIDPLDPHPYVVVSFADKRDRYETIRQQAIWLGQALQYLDKQGTFTAYEAIGHSNGGLNWTYYLESQDPLREKVRSLTTIGTPYNLREKEEGTSPVLADLLAQSDQLPTHVKVTNLSGQHDLLVSQPSSDAGKRIFHPHIASYQEIQITGYRTGHTALLTHQEVLGRLEGLAIGDRKY